MEIDDDRLDAAARRRSGDSRGASSDRPAALFQGAVPPAGRAGQAAGLGRRTRSSRSSSSSRAATPPARAASSSASPSASTRASAASSRCPRRTSASARSGISSATSPHLPAGGEIVLFDRSWYNRAGVERVMGFCTDDEYEEFFRTVPGVRADAGPLRHHPDQVLVLDHRRRAAPALQDAHPRSAQAVEAEPDGPRVPPALGGTTPRPRRRCSSAPTSPRRRWWVVEAVDKKRARLNCIQPPADARSPTRRSRTSRSRCPSACTTRTTSASPLPDEMYVPEVY